MPLRSIILLLLGVLVYCAAVGVVVGTLAQDRFPQYGGPILLAGILVAGLVLGLLAPRLLIGKSRRAQFAARFRESQRVFCLLCGIVALGQCLLLFGGVVEIIAYVITAGGLCALLWLVLRAIPPREFNDLGRGI
jgi:hypothetical protein